MEDQADRLAQAQKEKGGKDTLRALERLSLFLVHLDGVQVVGGSNPLTPILKLKCPGYPKMNGSSTPE